MNWGGKSIQEESSDLGGFEDKKRREGKEKERRNENPEKEGKSWYAYSIDERDRVKRG